MTKTYCARLAVTLPAALIAQQVLGRAVGPADRGRQRRAFVTAIGTLYSVLAGCTVVSVWQQFTDTDRAVKREGRGLAELHLAELHRYVGYVEDAEGVARARGRSRNTETRSWSTSGRR